MSYYPITEPITKTIVSTYETFQINNLVVVPFQQATMIVNCFTATGQIGFSQYLILQGDAYNQWNNNDEYLINWVNLQLHSIQ